MNRKLKSSRHTGLQIQLEKFVPLSIRSISSKRFTKKFAREFRWLPKKESFSSFCDLFAKNQTVNWISKHLAKNFISNLLKKLSLKSCARETYFTLHSCPGFGSRKFSNFKLFSPQHCRKVQTNRCAGECGCEQKYKWHRLLAYDPDNDCKGIFMDWFLFPSCCVCRCNPL